jgi:hypothetical protein
MKVEEFVEQFKRGPVYKHSSDARKLVSIIESQWEALINRASETGGQRQ